MNERKRKPPATDAPLMWETTGAFCTRVTRSKPTSAVLVFFVQPIGDRFVVVALETSREAAKAGIDAIYAGHAHANLGEHTAADAFRVAQVYADGWRRGHVPHVECNCREIKPADAGVHCPATGGECDQLCVGAVCERLEPGTLAALKAQREKARHG